MSSSQGATIANHASFAFEVSGLPSTTLQVRHVMGKEELSRPFAFQITLVSEDRQIDLDSLIGETARLHIRGLNGTRIVHGIVERFRHLVTGRHYVHYEAILVCPLQMLHYTRNSRIFQQRSTPDILQEVIASSPLQLEVRLALMGKYGARDFCVQYQESDLDFISRLLEEDGIFYFIDHSGEYPVLVLGDGPHAVEPLPQGASIEFLDESRVTVQQAEAIFDYQGEAALRSGGAVLRDFRFKNPGVSLEVSRTESRFQSLETYYYPGGYVSPDLGRELARIRLEEQVRDRQRFTGIATTRGLMPGHRFTLSKHSRDDFNRTYLICSVSHEATETPALMEEAGVEQTEPTSYRARFECIPVDVPFRPTLRTPRPVISGLQTAVVVGPGTEEIYCDNFGRVKVHFHWDRQGSSNENDSCWIRVGQSWGGPGFGSVFVPRIGQEVLVQFIEGDPDRPMIVGVVYNGQNPTPYGLPDAKTQSGIKSRTTPGGGGFNELRFEDAAGKEEVFLHGELDMKTVINRDHNQQYGRDRDTNIGRHNTIKVAEKEAIEVGDTQHLTVGSDRKVQVKGNQATQIDQNHAISVTQNHVQQIGGTKTQLVQGSNTSIFQDINSIFTKRDKFEVTRGNSNQHTANLARMSQQDLFVNTHGHNFITSQKTATVHSGTIHIQATGPTESSGLPEGPGGPMDAPEGMEMGGGMMDGIAGGVGELMPSLTDLFSHPFGMEAGIESMISGVMTGFVSDAMGTSGVGDAMSAAAGAASQASMKSVVSPNAQKLLGMLGMGFANKITPDGSSVEEAVPPKAPDNSILLTADDDISATAIKNVTVTCDTFTVAHKTKPKEETGEKKNAGVDAAKVRPNPIKIVLNEEGIVFQVGESTITLNGNGIAISSSKLISIQSTKAGIDIRSTTAMNIESPVDLHMIGKPIKLNC